MTTYNPVQPLTAFERFRQYCWDKFGADAPEAVTVLAVAFIVAGGLLGIVASVL